MIESAMTYRFVKLIVSIISKSLRVSNIIAGYENYSFLLDKKVLQLPEARLETEENFC